MTPSFGLESLLPSLVKQADVVLLEFCISFRLRANGTWTLRTCSGINRRNRSTPAVPRLLKLNEPSKSNVRLQRRTTGSAKC
jgi:hypothetical protein